MNLQGSVSHHPNVQNLLTPSQRGFSHPIRRTGSAKVFVAAPVEAPLAAPAPAAPERPTIRDLNQEIREGHYERPSVQAQVSWELGLAGRFVRGNDVCTREQDQTFEFVRLFKDLCQWLKPLNCCHSAGAAVQADLRHTLHTLLGC